MYLPIKKEILNRVSVDLDCCGFICHASCIELVPAPKLAKLTKSDVDRCSSAVGFPIGVYYCNRSGNGAFSDEDIHIANEIGVPIYLCDQDRGRLIEYVPNTYAPPIEGRKFYYGTWDCYGLVRDYWRAKGVYLSDYDRDTDANLRDLILARFEAEGFRRVSLADAHIGDVLMFESDRVLSNHFGILVAPSVMLHHLMGPCHLSCREVVTEKWLRRAVCAFRHVGMTAKSAQIACN